MKKEINYMGLCNDLEEFEALNVLSKNEKENLGLIANKAKNTKIKTLVCSQKSKK